MKPQLFALGVAALVVLAGCGDPGQGDLQAWMAQQKAETRPRVQPIAEPKKYVPQPYVAEGVADPFSPQKLAQALRREMAQSAASAALIKPELSRRKEPLETYPLASIAMVGSLVKVGQPVALLKVEGLLYQVRPGNYLGQNYGRVVRVGETEMLLREIVQDSAGDWVERMTPLTLQEKTK